MDLLTFLSGLLFGGDVASLGDADFVVRQAAYGRLSRAGAFAAPALRDGLRSAGPEATHRIGLLLRRMPGRNDLAAAALVRCPNLSDEFIRVLAVQMTKDPELAGVVFATVDARRGFSTNDSWAWAETLPYVTKSREGEFAHVLFQARRTWSAGPPQPMQSSGVRWMFSWR